MGGSGLGCFSSSSSLSSPPPLVQSAFLAFSLFFSVRTSSHGFMVSCSLALARALLPSHALNYPVRVAPAPEALSSIAKCGRERGAILESTTEREKEKEKHRLRRLGHLHGLRGRLVQTV